MQKVTTAQAASPVASPVEPRSDGTRALRPMFVVGGLYSLANGVAWIMRDLAAALGRAGAPVDVYGADCWGRGAASIGHIFEPPTCWHSARGLWLGGLSWSPPLKRKIQAAVAEHDIVHNHSLWMLPNSYASRAAVTAGKPTVITAHGALEPWALRNSGWKKKLVGSAFQMKDLQAADCIHVNSESEVDGIRSCGLRAPVAVIPNGVNLADYDSLPDRTEFDRRFPQLAGKKIALFMARLHEKKGLQYLLPAWGELAAAFPEWHLVVAGPDSGYRHQAERLVQSLGLRDAVSFVGPLHGRDKAAMLAAAGVLAHPSLSEGFSMAILEAMASRLPVLITPGCNFPEVLDENAGLSVNASVVDVAQGLRRLLSLSDGERRDMGARGRALVETAYTWDRVAQQTLCVYQWLLHGGPLPHFVRR